MLPVFALFKASIVWTVVGIFVVVGLVIWGRIYNKLVTLRAHYMNALGQIDAQMRRRHDLISNLIDVAKGHMSHDKQTLQAVLRARSLAVTAQNMAAAHPGSATAMDGLGSAEGHLSGTLRQFFALVEGYRDLHVNQRMHAFKDELTSSENQVALTCQAYNHSVMVYNAKRRVFPTSLIAGVGGFTPAPLFEIASPIKGEVPNVKS
jgi:LemA protein